MFCSVFAYWYDSHICLAVQWYNEIYGWIVLNQKATDVKYLLFNPIKRLQIRWPNESCEVWKRRLRRPILCCMKIHEEVFCNEEWAINQG
uniref:Uncharacterized protein n=1 Tax=viral metagenome TaxID=1070528 RepID=A0A6C0C0A3_9ZZZZ